MPKTTENPGIRRPYLSALLSHAFRPMFVAAASWAVLAIVVWLAMFLGALDLPTRFDPMAWHIHEMLFGFVMAAVAGFLLTAIPNWTGRLPVRGRPLALLVGLWLLGRIDGLISATLPAWLVIAADLSFPLTLLAVAARELVSGRAWRNLPMTVPLAILVAADLLMHLESLRLPVPGGLGLRLGLAAPIVLIAVIGGRIIPSFTRNWLLKRHSGELPAAHGRVDTAAVALLGVGLALWAVLPEFRWGGLVLVVAALVNVWRLARWAGASIMAEPLLLILHVGYAWVAAGTALLGCSVLGAGVPIASALHALTTGAIAVMILAVMPRVTLGHTGRALTADRATVAIFILINAAAIARVCASWLPGSMVPLLALSAGFWIGAFGVFLAVHGPMLLTPRRPNTALSP